MGFYRKNVHNVHVPSISFPFLQLCFGNYQNLVLSFLVLHELYKESHYLKFLILIHLMFVLYVYKVTYKTRLNHLHLTWILISNLHLWLVGGPFELKRLYDLEHIYLLIYHSFLHFHRVL